VPIALLPLPGLCESPDVFCISAGSYVRSSAVLASLLVAWLCSLRTCRITLQVLSHILPMPMLHKIQAVVLAS
jgi:hypothetical protein